MGKSKYRYWLNKNNPMEFAPGVSTMKKENWNSPRAFWGSNCEPNFSCPFERRIGENPNGDGAKWICDPHRIRRIAAERKEKNPDKPGCLIYSVGSNGQFGFGVAVQKFLGPDVCEIHIFDFGDYASWAPKDMNIHYHQWGLVDHKTAIGIDKQKPGQRLHSLQQTVQMLGHEDYPAIDIFKIDCEDCEWYTFKDWFAPNIPNMTQILVEVHQSPTKHVPPFFNTIEDEGYVIFHKEPNIQFSMGNCIEYAFLKLDKSFSEK